MTTTAHSPQAAETRTGGSLSLRKVHKRFGEHTAIREVDLEIRSGEFLSLLGPSGCGKTTLLRMIAGFEEPTSGSIELDGTDLTGLPPFRRPVNTVFQSYALFPHLSVAENIAYGLKRSKTVPRRELGPLVSEALEMVRMRDFADRRPAMLSGGQQQRVALARALVNRPRVLLLDEPMSALDRKLREEMQLELIRLHTDLGLTFVFVTHDQEEALAMSDRIVVMSDGEIQQVGESEEVYQSPANAFVAGFIGKQNFVEATVAREAGTELRTPHGSLEVSRGTLDGREAGSGVSAAVRPESVGVAAAAGDAARPNSVTGVVVGESFLGDVVQYLVRLDDGTELLARVRFASAPDVHEGERADLSWEPESVQVFDHE